MYLDRADNDLAIRYAQLSEAFTVITKDAKRLGPSGWKIARSIEAERDLIRQRLTSSAEAYVH